MKLEDFYLKLRTEIADYSNGRSDSSAFIIWFLENYFRIERQDAIDCVCDNTNDKGIDGIFVDDEDEVIYLLQSKYSPIDNQDQGDNDIRNFIGAKSWFNSEESLNKLLSSTASKELKSLVESSTLIEKTHYRKISVFITNKLFNLHATEFIDASIDLEVWDGKALFSKYTYFADTDVTFPAKDIYLTNKTRLEYDLPDGTVAKTYSVSAKELVKLDGIQDRSLFSKNVRYGVGNTRVNKSIKENISQNNEHQNFFLYHNGITIICDKLTEDLDNNKISIENYAVINGCQSMLTFYENKDILTKNLFVLVKIIELNLNSVLVKNITYFANNQNSIGLKDLRSNDPVQKALQKEFFELFGSDVSYIKKRGEAVPNKDTIQIDKDFAAQIITTIYLGRPQDTHLKQKLFGENYSTIFSRSINAEKVYLGYLIYSTISKNANLLANEKIRNYGLSLFFFSHAIAIILNEDAFGKKVMADPKVWVTEELNVLSRSIEKLWSLITPDINSEIDDYAQNNGGFLDYKNVFKNSKFVDEMSRRILTDYIKGTRRNENDKFENIYLTEKAK